jgi:hypothetical protein
VKSAIPQRLKAAIKFWDDYGAAEAAPFQNKLTALLL